MEALYKKLYDKYTKLKTKKFSGMDQLNKEQEVKFMNYLSAAEELIEHLKSENDKLHGQINELRNEVVSVRLDKDKQVADYQRLLMEENKKNETVNEEVEKMQKLLLDRTSGDLNKNSYDKTGGDQLQDISNSSSRRVTRKRKGKDALEKEDRYISGENSDGYPMERETTQNFCKETASDKDSSHCNWLIQALFEHALGMKLSTEDQAGQVCLSALHQSSGYSFSLSWIGKEPEEEAELLYHVVSLGTFERVAPEWMREDIMFSPTMCPVFFERVSHVIKLNH